MRYFIIVILVSLTTSVTVAQKTGTSLTWYVDLLQVKADINGSFSFDTLLLQEASILLLDSSFFVTRGSQRTVYDFLKEKIYFLNIPEKTYDETALYSEIDYRKTEFTNRLRLKNFLSEEGIENRIGSLYDLESLFGLELKSDSLAGFITVDAQENHDLFFYEGRSVSEIHYSEFPILEKDLFKKFLLYETQLHPLIVKRIIQNGKLPSAFSFIFYNGGKNYKVDYKLIKQNDQAKLSDLNPGSYIFKYQSKDDLITTVNKVYGFVHNNRISLKPPQYYQENFHIAMKKKDYIEAFLLLMECNLTENYDLKNELELLRSKAETDKRFQAFIASLDQPENQEEINTKIAHLEKLKKKKKFEHEFLIDAFLSPYYNALDKKAEAFQLLQNVISKNPYITSIYVDLGNLYAEQLNMRMAWKCYEIALKIDTTHPMARKLLLQKRILKQQFPDYF